MAKATYRIDSKKVNRFMESVVLPDINELRRWGFSLLDYQIDQMVALSVTMLTDADLGIAAEFDVS